MGNGKVIPGRPQVGRLFRIVFCAALMAGCEDPDIYLKSPCEGCDAALYVEEWDVFPEGPDVFGSIESAAVCIPNNDGIIEADEMPVVIGAVVAQRVNRPNQPASVDPVGFAGDEGWLWDFSRKDPGEVVTWLEVTSPEGTWFAPYFPEATNTAPISPLDPEILGVYRTGDGEVALLGLASVDGDASDRTLLVYDDPVILYQFPLVPGKTWSQTVTFSDALLKGVKNAGKEEYLFAVDARGGVQLPQFSLDNALRFRMRVRQSFVVGQTSPFVETIYYFWVSECLGEVARMISLPGETDLGFSTAKEYRRLSL